MPDPQSLGRDRQHIWHPFTPTRDAEEFPPLVIERARGIRLYDADGRAYFDTISSWWTNLHGHAHPVLLRAIKRQARRLDHVNFSGFTHRPALELFERLRERLPAGLSRGFFSDNGSTAVEAALKLAFQYFHNCGRPQKAGFAYLDGAYHGDTVGSLSVSGVDDFHELFQPLKFPALRLPAPWGAKATRITGNPVGLDCPEALWRSVETRLRAQADRLAAVIVEPLILCVGGMRPYPADFLRRLSALCRELDILVIYDEVATGFGRTGSFLALDQAGTVPDFLCLAKGLSGGILPLALTITSERIFEAFRGGPEKAFLHGHSYTANPIACAAGAASLRIFHRQKTLERLPAVAAILHDGIESLARLPGIADGRYLGMIGAVDLAHPDSGQPFPATARAGRRVYQASLAAGLVLRPLGDTIYWLLPLATRARDLREIMKRSQAVLADTLAGLAREFPAGGQAPRAPREV